MIQEQATVGSVVAERPQAARVFEEFGIDYCCGGGKTLQEAASERGAALEEILAKLAELSDGPAEGSPDCLQMTLTDLCDHIIERHHEFLRTELPRLDELTAKVAEVHAEREPDLAGVHTVFRALREELESHMAKEEMILFPLVRRLESGETAGLSHCGSIRNPIARMIVEHEDAGEALRALNDLTNGYRVPDWACNSYRVMLHGLAEFERDLHEHIHKENNILFPKAEILEAEVMG